MRHQTLEGTTRRLGTAAYLRARTKGRSPQRPVHIPKSCSSANSLWTSIQTIAVGRGARPQTSFPISGSISSHLATLEQRNRHCPRPFHTGIVARLSFVEELRGDSKWNLKWESWFE